MDCIFRQFLQDTRLQIATLLWDGNNYGPLLGKSSTPIQTSRVMQIVKDSYCIDPPMNAASYPVESSRLLVADVRNGGGRHYAFTRRGASWRRMLISHPPPVRVARIGDIEGEVDEEDCYGMNGEEDGGGVAAEVEDGGVLGCAVGHGVWEGGFEWGVAGVVRVADAERGEEGGWMHVNPASFGRYKCPRWTCRGGLMGRIWLLVAMCRGRSCIIWMSLVRHVWGVRS